MPTTPDYLYHLCHSMTIVADCVAQSTTCFQQLRACMHVPPTPRRRLGTLSPVRHTNGESLKCSALLDCLAGLLVKPLKPICYMPFVRFYFSILTAPERRHPARFGPLARQV
jgi:hypothetical protein